ncbi:unnamed protein product [Bursaphelenchus okinawaensis]|uniref:Uncharacterized protein n=1 Tax=Bursaphelenchus okinawaensis TaxID=465554 RepID=A0A811KQU7_9BILA|nr:unnamed protein product [Bursaphelenchus okinawaensis]CAG9108231.1 unnamed protein product [Bursaphelenchus okinawaensis]
MINASGLRIILHLTIFTIITQPAQNEVIATLRTIVLHDSNVGEWRLYNRCSHGFVQLFLNNVNAMGKSESECLTRFLVQKTEWDDSFVLKQVHSKRYLCLNSKMGLISKSNLSYRCRFKEHLRKSGYSTFESRWRRGYFIGFDTEGQPLCSRNSSQCFQFIKLASSANKGPNRDCPSAYRRRAHRFAVPQINEIESASAFDVLKQTFMQKVLL